MITLCQNSFESGQIITHPTRSNVCHIFPKRNYKSVNTNPQNIIFLTFEEHTKLDYYLDRMDLDGLSKEMPIAWKHIVEQVNNLLPY